MKAIIILLLLAIILSACAPSPQAIQQALLSTQAVLPTMTAYPTYTPNPTYTPYPTFTAQATYTPAPTYTPVIIIVTPTLSPTPLYTSTITPTPSNTPVPTNTPNALQADKGPGNYLVNVDIAPGVWRNDGNSKGCYWQRSDKTGDIIANDFGMGGGTMYIAPTDFSVEMDAECGNWTYLQGP
jgi:hypothetical protein